MPPVPCHNDLTTGNVLFTDDRAWLLDFEFAGMNDPFFDLGSLSVNGEFPLAIDEALVRMYFGDASAGRRVARLQLMKIMCLFRQGMWGVVQQALGTIEADFAGYAERAPGPLRAPRRQPRLRGLARAGRAARGRALVRSTSRARPCSASDARALRLAATLDAQTDARSVHVAGTSSRNQSTRTIGVLAADRDVAAGLLHQLLGRASRRSSSSSAPPPAHHRASIDSVASGWNCVAKLRPSRHACGPTALRAISSAPAGTVTTSECHCSHGPVGDHRRVRR